MRKRLAVLMALILMILPFSGLGMAWASASALGEEDEEIFFSDRAMPPSLYFEAPLEDASYEAGSKLTVIIIGTNVTKISVKLEYEDGSLMKEIEGDRFEFTFDLPRLTTGLCIRATGYGYQDKNGYEQVCEKVRDVISPKDELINKMIKLAYANSKDSRYNFAPAEEDHHIGVCKNFVMRLFDTYSKDYRMLAYPDLEMHMPKNNSKVNCKPYDYGIEWRIESADMGSPFEIVAQFKYNNDLSKEENAALALEMMKQVKRGDFFQMVGYYGGGNGPHSLYFIADYDPGSNMLHWTDSNMRGKRIDGVRWGYMQYDADATPEWFVNCINTRNRGATLYRLRDDLFRQ